MLKLRLRFADDEEGRKELKEAIKKIKKEFDVIYESGEYKDRGQSKYARIYLEIKNR